MTAPQRLRLAYVISQFPEIHESFIAREIQMVVGSGEVDLAIFSLKPCRDAFIQNEARLLVTRTEYPSVGRTLDGLRGVWSSRQAQTVVMEVLSAYRLRPRALTKAIGTLFRAAGALPSLRKRGSAHVHAHWATMPALAAYFLHRVSGIPYSVTAHAWDIYAETAMLREKMAAAEFVVTCTKANRMHLMALAGERTPIFLSYHGLDFSQLAAPHFQRDRRLSILAVGRLVEQKGFRNLIDACGLLAARGRVFDCRIIGEGPLRHSLEAAVRRLGLESRVKLLGQVPLDAVFRAYEHGSVLCVPSVVAADGDRDGIPNVIIEAMAHGLPVVASAVSGIPEIVRQAETGWLVPSGDVGALTAALEEIGDDVAGDRVKRATMAYEVVRREFDARRNVEALLGLFRGENAAGPARTQGVAW